MIIYSPRRIAPVTLVVGLLGAVLIGLPCQAPRELWVTSNPPGASVSFRGRPCGVTPCRILVGPRGPLRLQSTGYLPEEEFLRLQAPGSYQLHLKLRPGVGAGLPPYPPSLGRPPLTRLQRHTLALDGHPYALPPGWRVQPGHAHGLQLLSGDGVGQPIRQARLQVLPPSDLDSLWSQQLQSKEDQGWTIVAWQRGGLSQWARLERPHQLGLSRGALVIQAEPGRLLLLDYEFEDGYDLFTVTRDLDYLRSSLGFDW